MYRENDGAKGGKELGKLDRKIDINRRYGLIAYGRVGEMGTGARIRMVRLTGEIFFGVW